MLPLAMSVLLATSSVDKVPPQATNGFAVGIGVGMMALAENRLDADADALGGIPLEISLLQHDDRFWFGAGVSWMFGSSTIATDSRDVKANLVGLHGDLDYSVMAFEYADVKLGVGAAMRYASIAREEWSTGMWEIPARTFPASHQKKILATGRVRASLLLHSSGASGGLELIPLRIEYGPSLFMFAPTLSFSRFF